MENNLDLAIIGAGPAALTAALYASRLGLKVEVFEKKKVGGSVNDIPNLSNFPGFDGKGEEFISKLRSQAESFGAKISFGTCTSIEPLIIDDEIKQARAILIATGTEPRSLAFDVNIPVSYCALCDGPLMKDKNIVIVGGANSAFCGAIYLSRIAKSITIISHSKFKCDKEYLTKIKKYKNISLIEELEPTKDYIEKFDACFVFIGNRPATTFCDKKILDKNGEIVTNNDYQTLIPNVFAAGDVRKTSVKQVITASAEGAAAAKKIADFLLK